ncbi:hypothetical protein JOB18_020212 [Solea senegalensis]|uniref:Uncharacterized protein n=1 Tax=Solea senegalensis TaxID=28829 RepID=A0AAV6SXI1_SOLSE|nr:hypothetical protein JOB18_020212 [Solea senegalensis]
MVRSWPVTWPERAEQWCRSADGAAEGTASRSVSLAEPLGPLRARTYNGGWSADTQHNPLHSVEKWEKKRRTVSEQIQWTIAAQQTPAFSELHSSHCTGITRAFISSGVPPH